MRKIGLVLCAALALAACDDKEKTTQAKSPPPPPPSEGSANEALKALNEQSRSALATLTPDKPAVEIATKGGAAVTISNDTGPTATPRSIQIIPEHAEVSATLQNCDRGLVKGDNCIVSLASTGFLTTEAALIISGDQMNPATINVKITAPPPPAPEQHEVAIADPNEPYRQQMIAMAAFVSPLPHHTAPAVDRSSEGTTVQVPIPPALNPLPHQIFSPQRDLSRVISPVTRISLTLQNDIITTRKGEFRARVTYPVYGGFTNGHLTELIPQNSWATGTYDVADLVSEKVFLHIGAIYDPKGRALVIRPRAADDAQGRAGTPAQVDRQIWESAGAQLLAAAIAISPAFILPNQDASVVNSPLGGTTVATTERGQAIQQFQSNANAILQDAVKKSIDTSPRGSIPTGTTLVISPDRDWWFPDESDQEQLAKWVSTLPKDRDQQ